MKLFQKCFLIVIALWAGAVRGQVATGTPAFGTFGGGPFDTVNSGNLNAHFAIPVLQKAGRGMPFVYDLTYDSSVWTPVTSSGVTQWEPAIGWGWNTDSAALSGYVTATEGTTNYTMPCAYSQTTWSNYVYHDSLGRSHPFNINTYLAYIPCIHPPVHASGNRTGQATDGSGISITANMSTWTITYPSGRVITGPLNSRSSSGTVTDANGNELTVNSSGQYFDTLSSTTPVLTLGGSGTVASPNTFSYTAPSGATASYTMSYTQYSVKTAFGVSNSGGAISEYGPTSVPLVSSIQLPDGTSYSFTYEQTPGSCTPLSGTASTCVTARIATVTLPTGGTVTYAYSGGPNSTGIYSDGSTAGLTRSLSPNTCTSGGCWQYSRALQGTTAPGPGSAWITTVVDPQGNYTVESFAEDSTFGAAATYNLYETQKQVYQGSVSSSNLLLTRIDCYNGNYASCASATVSSPITKKDAYKELPNGSTRLSEFTYNGAYTGSGLVSDDKEYDYGVSMGSAPGTTHLIKEVATTYASVGNGIINKPATVTTSDWTSGSAVTVASRSYTYDQTSVTATTGTPQHTSITGGRGNLTTLATQVNSGTTLYRAFTYYDTGKPNTSTDVSTSATSPGVSTTYVYGSGSCGNSFATGINEPLSLVRSTTWNCTGAVATGTTDENSQTVTTAYSDPYFWRPASVTDQALNQTTVTYDGETAEETTLLFNSNNSVSDTLFTVDSFGRPILNQAKQGPTATNYDTTETDYNSLGQPDRSTMPFSAAAGGASTTAPGKSLSYDALGRKLIVTKADYGTIINAYTNNDVLRVVGGPSGTQTFSRNFEYDGLGRLKSVCEISSTLPGTGSCGQTVAYTGYLTNYTYDALGHLLTVTQNAQASSGHQSRTYTYDMLGRMVTESNPETSNTGSNGTTTYTYDVASGTCAASAGNMTTRLDPAGNTTCFTYDALHRVTDAGSNSPGSTSVCRHFRYDTSPTPYNSGVMPTGVSVSNTKARLEEAATDNCSYTSLLTDEWFSYSVRGELTDVYQATPHSGQYYHTTAAYWPSGALQTLSGIPSVPTLYYGAGGTGLDGEGRYTQVTASTGTNPVTAVTYSSSSTTNPLGSLTSVTYGSADSDSFSYDPGTGRFSTYSFSVSGSTDAGTLTWSPNGTLSNFVIADSISGTSDSQSCSYYYDDLGRIGGGPPPPAVGYSIDCGTSWQQQVSYDAFGNITKTGASSFSPTYSSASNQFTLGSSAYDGNGNMTTDNLNTYTWDSNWGTVSSVSTGSATLNSVYDAQGRAVEQQNGTSYSEILYSPIGKTAIMNVSSLTSAFVNLPGGGTAVYNSSGLSYYRHSDWLGSSRLASTQSQTLYSSTSYAPFGEQYATAGSADASFTGQYGDQVTNLYDFPMRRHNPSMGRWISPDPSGVGAVHIKNPQSWNRYAYVTNRPLDRVDPLGLDDCACDLDDNGGDDSSGGGGGGDGSGDGNGGGDGSGGAGDSSGGDGSITVTADPIDTTVDTESVSTDATVGDCNSAAVCADQSITVSATAIDTTVDTSSEDNNQNSFSNVPINDDILTHWPFNGNLLPLKFQAQDGVCTTGPFANSMNSNPAILACCAAHDACYTKYQCNATSFIPGGFPGPCKYVCNATVVACIATAK